MIFKSKKIFPFPQNTNDYFYLMGVHYTSTSSGYYCSYSSNQYGFVSFDKTRCFYEKISKREYFDKKNDFILACDLISDVKQRIQLTFSF